MKFLSEIRNFHEATEIANLEGEFYLSSRSFIAGWFSPLAPLHSSLLIPVFRCAEIPVRFSAEHLPLLMAVEEWRIPDPASQLPQT